MKDLIYYKKRKKYKYNLHKPVFYETSIHVDKPGSIGFLSIEIGGKLIIESGYAWDGPSGPSMDTKNFMRGSLIHDALYQLVRERILLPRHRKQIDKILRDICIEDGMSRFRAWYVYRAVRMGGASSIKPDLLTAPSTK